MQHGGKRTGAGRKVVAVKAKSRVMRVPESTASTVKHVIEALKNDPTLEKSILNAAFGLVIFEPEEENHSISIILSHIRDILENEPGEEEKIEALIYGIKKEVQHKRLAEKKEELITDSNGLTYFKIDKENWKNQDYMCENCARFKTDVYKNDEHPCMFGICTDEKCYWLPVEQDKLSNYFKDKYESILKSQTPK